MSDETRRQENTECLRVTEKELTTTNEKLKRCYQSQDKLVPLFDDPEQSIDTCYIRLQKNKMKNNQEKEKEEKEKDEENEKDKDYKEEDGEW
ncbi:hypothetical protein RFI_06005, partial [Reticulomyxa filosa]